MRNYFLLLFTTTLLLSNCTSVKKLKMNSNKILLKYDKALGDSLKVSILTIPTCDIWNKDRDDFIMMIEDYKAKNEIVRTKSNNTATGFTITGTVIGVGGGVYGLFSNTEPKGAAITSLITGALTGLFGSLNLQKKSERASTCSDFLNVILLDFRAYWGVARCPSNENEFKTYLTAKDEIIERLKGMKCFGLPSSQ